MSDQAAYDVEHPPAPQGARRGGPVDAHVGVGARQPGGVPRAARGVDRDTPPGAASLAVAAQGREEFLSEARREADDIIEAGRVRAERMVERTEVVREARRRADRRRRRRGLRPPAPPRGRGLRRPEARRLRGRPRTDAAGGREGASACRSSSRPIPRPRPSQARRARAELEELPGSIEVEAELEETFFDQDAR